MCKVGNVRLGVAELERENRVQRQEWYVEMSSEGKEGNRRSKGRLLQKRKKNKTNNWFKNNDPENSIYLPSLLTNWKDFLSGKKEV